MKNIMNMSETLKYEIKIIDEYKIILNEKVNDEKELIHIKEKIKELENFMLIYQRTMKQINYLLSKICV